MANQQSPPDDDKNPKRKRLERVFEVASKKAATSASANDFAFVTDLLSECVAGEPGNPVYLKAYLENLHKRYGNNKKGASLAQFKERSSRSGLKKAIAQEQWDEAIQHGLKVLTVNPWETQTLTGLATAAAKLGYRDCELCYLESALRGSPKDPLCNKMYALALEDRELIDQAIVFWHRVEEALPNNEEARRHMATLTVRKARSRGEYDSDDEASRKLRQKTKKQQEFSKEETLRQKIKAEPNNLSNYLDLAEIYLTSERYAEGEQLLATAFDVSDGDADIREKWEDAQLRSLRQKIAKTTDPEAKKQLQADLLKMDIDAHENRVQRFPTDMSIRYDLGYRYMLAKRFPDAIRELQAARNEPRRRGVCNLALGQCFQHIKQYPLAMSHYEMAITEIPERDTDNRKRALYLAGRLAANHINDLASAQKYLTTLASLDFAYKDVSELLDKIATLRDNPQSPPAQGSQPGAA